MHERTRYYNDSFLLDTAVEALLSLAHNHHCDHHNHDNDDGSITSTDHHASKLVPRRNGTDAMSSFISTNTSISSNSISSDTNSSHPMSIKMNPKKRKNSFVDVTCNTSTFHSHGSKLSFPLEIFHVLNQKEMQHIVSWTPDGKSFIIHNMETFQNYILPHYFNNIKFDSFQRKLYRWGFTKNINVHKDREQDLYHHSSSSSSSSSSRKKQMVMWSNALFQRNKPHLCHEMACSTKTPNSNNDRKKKTKWKHYYPYTNNEDSDDHSTNHFMTATTSSHGTMSKDSAMTTSSWQLQ